MQIKLPLLPSGPLSYLKVLESTGHPLMAKGDAEYAHPLILPPPKVGGKQIQGKLFANAVIPR